MKPSIKIGVLALILCLAVFLIVLGAVLLRNPQGDPAETTVPTTVPTTSAPEQTTVPEPTEPPLDPLAEYTAAVGAAQEAENWYLIYSTSQIRQVGTDIYTQSVSGTGAFSALFGDSMTAIVEETREYGAYANDYMEVYCEGTAYAEMADLAFSKTMTAAEFLQRQIPGVLLSSELYGSITGERSENGITIEFSDPTALEGWMAPENGQLISASGTVLLSSDGVLLESSYSAEFSLGEVIYTYTAEVQFSAPAELDTIEEHSHYKTSQAVEDLDVLKTLLQVVGDLFTANTIRCEAVETIDCPQIPLNYIQESSYSLLQDKLGFVAGVDHVSQITDYREQPTVRIQSDSFIDGVFTSVVDGGEPVTDPEMTRQRMRQTVEDAVLSAMMAPTYLAGASRTDNGDTFTIQMTGNDAFCKDLMAVITAFLQVDLDTLATSYKTTAAEGYLTVDKQTLLPTAMGLTFQRVHTTTGGEFTLTYSMEHTLQLSAE